MSICIDRYEYLPWNDNSEYLPGKSGINVYLERPIFTWNDRYLLGTTYFYLKELIYTWNDLNLPGRTWKGLYIPGLATLPPSEPRTCR